VTISKLGRHAVSIGNLPRGSVVLRETPTAGPIIRERFAKDICASCLAFTVAVQLQCSVCGLTAYCSNRCKALHTSVHSMECRLVALLPKLSRELCVDLDLMRLAVRVVLCRELNEPAKVEFMTIQSLETHRDSFPVDWLKAVSNACESVVKAANNLAIKNAPNMLVSVLLDICCKINVNSYGFRDDSNMDFAVALVPVIGTTVNHSCAPNCAFNSQGPALELRALRDIQEGEELFVSYIDLYQSRQQRQAELKATKFFLCTCARCASDSPGSLDQRLSGFRCLSPTCRPVSSGTKGDDSHLRGIYVASQLSTSTSNTNSTVISAVSSSGLQDYKENKVLSGMGQVASVVSADSYVCSQCGHSVAAAVVIDAERRLSERLEAATRRYKERKLQAAVDAFQGLVEEFSWISSAKPCDSLRCDPLHEILLQAHCKLVSLRDAQNDVKGSIRHLRCIIGCVEKVLPPCHLEVATYLFLLGERLEMLAVTPGLNRRLAADYKADAAAAFERCAMIRATNRGQAHPTTEQALAKARALSASASVSSLMHANSKAKS
jgi:hypothetical protein